MLKCILSIGSVLLSLVLTNAQPQTGTFIDERDGQVYKWVNIANQTWMAQNLNIESVTFKLPDNTIKEEFIRRCYEDDPHNCRDYGGLYTQNVISYCADAFGLRNICPEGWHLPRDYEWLILIDYLGGQKVAGNAMKETGSAHWKGRNKGMTNSSGFSALPAGICIYNEIRNKFMMMGATAAFWSSTRKYSIWFEVDGFSTFNLYKNSSKVRKEHSLGVKALSVRCIKD